MFGPSEIASETMGQVWNFLGQKRHWQIGVGPAEATNIAEGLKHKKYKGRRRELGLFSPEENRQKI